MPTLKGIVLLFLATACAFAHAGEPLEPHDLWTAWSLDPGVVAGLAISAVLYALGARDSRVRGFRGWEIGCFWAGWLAAAAALVSPLHAMGEALFSAHMVQHEVLMLVAAPLLVLGRPGVVFLWALPRAWRPALGRLTLGRAATSPVGAWSIHAVVLWVWHAPALFQATLQSDAVHAFQHVCFLGSALLFWWVVLRGRPGAAVLSIFTTAVHTTVLGALLTFSRVAWYPAYGNTAAWGLTALEDQQIGGLIMWVPAGLVYITAGLAAAARLIRRSEAVRAALALICSVGLLSCGSRGAERAAVKLTGGGDPSRGKAAVRKYGCASCHTIPGVPGAHGLVGPPLTGFGNRVYIGGVLPNTPSNLFRWIQNARAVDEKSAMPDMGVTQNDARDIAAFLYTLK